MSAAGGIVGAGVADASGVGVAIRGEVGVALDATVEDGVAAIGFELAGAGARVAGRGVAAQPKQIRIIARSAPARVSSRFSRRQ
ncbi:MAG: hypothetical protein ACR2H0_02870 [Candidatus Limnocylindrales bacterium]